MQNADIVAAPSQADAVVSAPVHKLLHALGKSRRVAENLLRQPGHALDPGMNGQIVGGTDGNGDGIDDLHRLIHLGRADLDDLK